MPEFNADRAATVLVDAAFRGDKRTAKKHGVTTRSIQSWRHRLDTDGAFFAIFRARYDAAISGWADDLAAAKVAAIRFLFDAAQTARPNEPAAVGAVTDAFRALIEAEFTREVLNARIAQLRGAKAEDDRPLATSGDPGQDGNYLEGPPPSAAEGSEGGGAV